MSKYWLLLTNVYKNKIKSKPFIAVTILFMILLSVVIFWQNLQEKFFIEDQNKILLIDNTEKNAESFFSSNNLLSFEKTNSSIEEIDQSIISGDSQAALVLTSNQNGSFDSVLRTSSPLDLQVQNSIKNELEVANKLFLINNFDLPDSQKNTFINSQVNLKEFELSAGSNSKSIEEKRNGTIVAYVFGTMVYIFVALYLSMITTEVATEKSSRIMEILMSSVSPITHLFAKVSGIFLVAMTQFAFLILYSFLLSNFSSNENLFTIAKNFTGDLDNLFFVYSFTYLLLSYLLYLFIGALLGSMVSKVEETSQVILPATLTITVGFYVMITGLYNPDSLVIKIFSFIPFTSGLVMPLRISATSLSNTEVIISILILVLTIFSIIFVSLKLYQGSVLSYKNGSIFKKLKRSWKSYKNEITS